MASITFLDSGDLDRPALAVAMARFIDGLVADGRRVALRVADDEKAARWDQFLWSWDDQSFIPHSVLGAEWPADEPVTIATRLPPATPEMILICLVDVPLGDLDGYDDVYEIVDRNSDDGVVSARERWSTWKASGRRQEYRRDWAIGGPR